MKQYSYNRYFAPFLFFVPIFLIFFFTSKLSPYFTFNSWSDINVYNTIGKSIWHGKVIYKDLFDHKGPLIFFIYSLNYIFSKNSFLGIFFVQVIAHTVSFVFAYRSVRLFNNDKLLSFVISLLLFVFVIGRFVDGGSAEEFILLFEVIGLYYILKYFVTNNVAKPKYMLIHGILCSAIFFIKLNLVVFFFFPIVFVLLNIYRNDGFKSFIKNILYFILGFLLVALPIILYFLFNGALSDFFSAYFLFNYMYGSQEGFSFIEFYRLMKINTLAFSFIFLGLVSFLFVDLKSKWLLFFSILLSFITTVLIVVPGSMVKEYYILVLLIFTVPGFISISLLSKKISSYLTFFKYIVILVSLSFAVYSVYKKSYYVSFLNEGYASSQLYTELPKLVKSDKLLSLTIDHDLYLYTELNIVPSYKYFFYPNINYDTYPLIRDTQTEYLLSGDVDYAIVVEKMKYQDYYVDILKDRYSVILEFQHPFYGNTYYLYKRNGID